MMLFLDSAIASSRIILDSENIINFRCGNLLEDQIGQGNDTMTPWRDDCKKVILFHNAFFNDSPVIFQPHLSLAFNNVIGFQLFLMILETCPETGIYVNPFVAVFIIDFQPGFFSPWFGNYIHRKALPLIAALIGVCGGMRECIIV